MTLLFSINFLLSMIFMSLTHPLSMGLILLIQTMIISLITGNFFTNFWFSYILFLILIGGMLILFIYMTSVASNEKFKFNINIIMTVSLIISLIIPLILKYSININLTNNEMINYNNYLMMNTSMTKFINFPLNMLLMFIIIYLFLTLIAVVKITNMNYGPLRQLN
uniref:NADH-ubiquinone oxidoreductase chain 6 n=1 Tax=Trictenotoma davidi TaxID=2813663 RepID=A0A8A3WL78_9CUCU|nr:NADH dehydrogenase subunit 6 [Trictenotoma davidi]QTA72355.1 NADH dehydrogenase subunit 6 [Trictenotoma davidi]